MDRTYRFRVDLLCHLANGDTDTLLNFHVAVEAPNKKTATGLIPSVATEMVHDRGSRLLDAPLDRLEVLRTEDD